MRKLIIVFLLIGLSFPLFARDNEPQESVSANDILKMYPSLDGKAVSEITVNEVLEFAEMASVARQEQQYISGAAISSLIIPGMGQFKTDDVLGGVLHLASGIAITGGSLYGSYLLLPEAFKTVLGNKTAMQAYMETNDRTEMLPSMGVMLGGGILYLINTHLSAHGAAVRAEEQIKSGEVTFEPNLSFISGKLGLGMHIKM